MDLNSETKKVLIMGVAGLILCILIFVSVVSQLLNKDNQSDSERDELASGQANYKEEISTSTTYLTKEDLEFDTSWQQPVDEFVYEETEIYSFDNVESDNVPNSENTQVENEQISPDLSSSVSNTEVSTSISPPEIVPLSVVVPNTTYPSLGKVKFDECGTLVVPSGPTLALFAFTAGKDPTVVCLGEAVAKRCNDSKTEIQKDGLLAGFVYVIERPDKVCSVGLSTESSEVVSLCSIEKIMNSNVEKKKNFTEWQKVFKAEPGTTFASMYFDNSSKLSDPALASQFDCQTFKFE